MGDGGKWVCGLERIVPKQNCVIYSFGADSIFFDMKNMNSTGRLKRRILLRG